MSASQLKAEREALENRVDVNPDKIGDTKSDKANICALGVDGCTAMFIWASSPKVLVCIHATAGTENLKSKAKLGAERVQASNVTDVYIVAPDEDDLKLMKNEFKSLFPKITPEGITYPYKQLAQASDSTEWWDIEGNVGKPGKVKVKHETD